ncbi:MAG: glycosyltransferase [Verrucomicrobia bacterium]|nr:glycosyltransferase [Verrucomicrobiota bacterium]MBI3869089.1 glycosyltransferase [Verrucomicrobiota bacterium]
MALKSGDVRLCLVMIVRNEANVIARCLDSVAPLIDCWVICDTGSDDATKDIIRERLKDIPGELHDVPWVNFGHNRSDSLARARGKGTHLLMLNADETIHIHSDFPPEIPYDGCLLRYTGKLDYSLPLLLRSDVLWHFVGVTHEYLSCSEPATYGRLECCSITHHFDGGMRGDKFGRDIRLLTQALKEDPENRRSMFYLAQSYRDIGMGFQALQWYERRAAVADGSEEAWYSQYQAAKIRQESAQSWAGVLDAYLKAYQMRPGRLEPLWHVARHYRMTGQFMLGWMFARMWQEIPYPGDILFIEREVYSWQLPLELALCCEALGLSEEARGVFERLRTVVDPSQELSVHLKAKGL